MEKCSSLCSSLCLIDEINAFKKTNILFIINNNYVMLNEQEIKLLILNEIKKVIQEKFDQELIEKKIKS